MTCETERLVTTDLRRLATEALGNALLLFLAIGAAVTGVAATAGLTLRGPGSWADTVLLALGLVALGVAYDNGPLSRIHLSPAVTGAALLGRRVTGPVAVKHWLAQAVGAIIAVVGLWQFVPWVLPAADSTTALATAQTIAFTSQDIVIVGIASVALTGLPFIVAAISAALRGPSVVEFVAAPPVAIESEVEQPTAEVPAKEAVGALADTLDDESDNDPDQPTDAPADQQQAAPPAASEITPELVREILAQLFVPVAEPALAPPTPFTPRPAAPKSPSPRQPDLDPVASAAESPAATLFSAAEREAHLREFLDIPTRHDVTRRTVHAQETESPEVGSRSSAGKRDRPAEAPAAKDRKAAKGSKVDLTETSGNLALVRSLPLQDKAHAEVQAKAKRRKAKAEAKGAYTVTVTVTVGEARGKKK